MVILVMGGAGCVGSHTARALRHTGHEVIIFDNLSTGYGYRATGFELVEGDVLDTAAMAPSVAPGRCHHALHGAPLCGRIGDEPKKIFP